MLYMSVINCFGIEMVLCDLYFKTKGLLFDTFIFTVWYKLVYDKPIRSFDLNSPVTGTRQSTLSQQLQL